MLIGIVETGRPPSELRQRFTDYPQAFEQLLARLAPPWRFRRYRALEDELPLAASECDAWLITGSRAAVYDADPWIGKLQLFLREAFSAGTPTIGICFGHQLLAQALGGRVEKSQAGWGVGAHEYRLLTRPSWCTGTGAGFRICAFHQDQVIEPPAQALTVAGNEFCPHAVLDYGGRALTIQGHPEFTTEYAAALLAVRRGSVVPEALADAALESLALPIDAARVADWIGHFLRRAVGGQADSAC